MVMASISAIANFLLIPTYPFFVAADHRLDVWLIWALVVQGRRWPTTAE
jgi:hypothetical protein